MKENSDEIIYEDPGQQNSSNSTKTTFSTEKLLANFFKSKAPTIFLIMFFSPV